MENNSTKPLPTPCAAIVTGGAGAGIGSAIVSRLFASGWSVLCVDKDVVGAAAVRDSLVDAHDRVQCLELDVTLPGAAEAAVAKAVDLFGRIDGLVNSAGIGLVLPLGEVDDDAFDLLFNVDFRAVFRFCRAALPHLLSSRGAIVNIGSVHARQAMAGYGLYAACKAAIEGLTRGLAVDYGPQGLRVNCIHPGFVPSPQSDLLIAKFASDPEQWKADYARTKQAIPALIDAEEVGNLVAFLLASGNRTLTGQSIALDGGTTALLYDREASL
jgi:NAD(P)-dependent dehydrogenase (short-subunit alcohol dehydrogenase family)